MRSVDSDTLAALAARQLKARNFIWITGKDNMGVSHSVGFWDDLGDVSAEYLDVTTGLTSSRNYTGAGTLLGVDNIPLVSDVSVRNVTVTLSQINEDVANVVRGYDVRGGPVEIHRGLFNPGTFKLVAPLSPRFVGFVDTMEILDPAAGATGQITINLVSHTRELTRTNTDVCSNDSQNTREELDSFYKDVGVVGTWQIYWGEKRGTITPRTNNDNGAYD